MPSSVIVRFGMVFCMAFYFGRTLILASLSSRAFWQGESGKAFWYGGLADLSSRAFCHGFYFSKAFGQGSLARFWGKAFLA